MARKSLGSSAGRLAGECLALRVRMLDRSITSLYDEALRPLKLKITQLNILLVIGKHGVARPTQICGLLRMDASTLSRNADRMVARGWIEVVPTSDARAQPLRLTRRGAKLIEDSVPAWEEAQAKVEHFLGRTAMSALMKTAEKAGLGMNLKQKSATS